jgi:beta-galactosidase GanA
MQDSSMNLVRVGDVHGSWDRIEPREGDFSFSRLERFYDLADKYGIRILLSNGACCPPLWLKTKYPDISLLSSRGEKYPTGSSYHWACIHHPGYLNALEAYTTKLATVAIQFPNHLGWQITNEIGFPFLPTREKNELGLYCYCDHCQEKFQRWLKEKYATLDDLTQAWSWGTTNFVYNDWSEAVGPESLPASWSGVTRWIDWRIFWQDAFAAFAGWQHDLIKEIDPDHPTSINTFNFKGYDRFGTFMGLDQWKIAKQVDHIGYDLYPGSGDKRKTRPEHSSLFLDHGRSVAQSTGRDFWLHEIESGPIGGWLMGPEYNTGPRDIDNYIIESLGHNAKLLIYMPWREWRYQPLRWGALVDMLGGPTTRLKAASALGRLMQENAAFLAHAQPPHAEVAILESKPNAIFLRGVHQEELLFQAQRGAYRAFWDQGYSVDFITPAQLTDPANLPYQYICLPLMGLLSAETAKKLEEYVKAGGVLLGFSRLATMDDNGWSHPALPLGSLGRIFGVDKIVADKLQEGQIQFKKKLYPGAENRDLLIPKPETEIWAVFQDGKPAVTRARLGAGLGVYISTQADIAYLKDPQCNLLGSVIKEIDKKEDIRPKQELSGDFTRARGVDPHILEGDQRTWILFSNYLNQDQSGEYSMWIGDRSPDQIMKIFPDRSAVKYKLEGNKITIPINFKEKEVMILELCWK